MEMIAPENTRVISTLEQPALEHRAIGCLRTVQLPRIEPLLICLDSLGRRG
jgi:hypothetical protein